MPISPPAWFVFGVAFLFGANVGSFLNVVAHRLPLGLSVVSPRSRCPACRSPIAARDNVPVLSWLLLGGRCRGCMGRISSRYALVEAFTGLLAVHATWALVWEPGRVGDPLAWAQLAVVFVVAASLLAASLIDADLQILPDEITIRGMWLGPVACAFVPGLVLGPGRGTGEWVPWELPEPLTAVVVSVVGMAGGASLIYVVGRLGTLWFKKDAMGFGDVKLLGMIGAFTGPIGALVALVLASLTGSLYGLPRLIRRRTGHIPFGPFLALGGYLYLVHGTDTVAWYLDLLRR